MAPLLNHAQFHDSSEDVFNLWPLKMELDAATDRKPFRPSVLRFEALDQIINPFHEYYTDDDTTLRWYSMEELQRIKLQAKEDSNAIRQSSTSQDTSLCVAHRKTSLMLKSDFKSLVKLSPTTPDQDLSDWCSFDDGRRGLERFASRDYAALRRSDIHTTRTSVIDEYARQRNMQNVDHEAVANLARESSRRSRTFARFFAEADAGASKKTQHDEPFRRLPSRCRSEVQSIVRHAPPRKRSKQYHKEDFYPVSSH
jgi:hypothetical protein